MSPNLLHIFLADDDKDDCLLFKEALDELSFPNRLTLLHDGEKLMTLLETTDTLPNVIFLDLNMPRKSGYQCLNEIKSNQYLHHLPVIIYSTSFEQSIVDQLRNAGAHFYIRKPAEFCKLKGVIHEALSLITQHSFSQPNNDFFVLKGDRILI